MKVGDEIMVEGSKAIIKSIVGRLVSLDVFDPIFGFYSLERDYEYLQYVLGQQVNKNYEVCPKCASDWKISKFNMHVWKDCTTCNKTYEELCK